VALTFSTPRLLYKSIAKGEGGVGGTDTMQLSARGSELGAPFGELAVFSGKLAACSCEMTAISCCGDSSSGLSGIGAESKPSGPRSRAMVSLSSPLR
jgi:hypothetical protein